MTSKMLYTKTIERIVRNSRIKATFKYELLEGNTQPYFSATYEEKSKYANEHTQPRSLGCNYEMVLKAAPGRDNVVRWHLCGPNGPMHYVSNALYWLGFNDYDVFNLDNFKSTIVFGALEDDQRRYDNIVNIIQGWTHDPAMDRELFKDWLEERLPRLVEQFHKDMATIFNNYREGQA